MKKINYRCVDGIFSFKSYIGIKIGAKSNQIIFPDASAV
jgi:hypothetical protein